MNLGKALVDVATAPVRIGLAVADMGLEPRRNVHQLLRGKRSRQTRPGDDAGDDEADDRADIWMEQSGPQRVNPPVEARCNSPDVASLACFSQ